MDIGKTDGAGRIDGVQRTNRIAKAYPTAGPQAAGDQVSISPEAALISKALAIPDVRMDRIQEVRKLVDSGKFETDARLEGALKRFMVENPDINLE